MPRRKEGVQIEMSPIGSIHSPQRALLKHVYLNPVRPETIEKIIDETDHNDQVDITKFRHNSSFFNCESLIPEEWAPRLPIFYKLSSFFYAASAVHEIYVNETIGLYSLFARFEVALLLITAILSYLSDTQYAGQTSIFHLLDRIWASTLFSWFFAKCTYMTLDFVEWSIFAISFATAFACFCFCRVMLQSKNFYGFVTSKFFWHLILPAGGSSMLAYRMGQITI